MNSSLNVINSQCAGAQTQNIVDEIVTILSSQLSASQIHKLDDLVPAAKQETQNALSRRKLTNLGTKQQKEITYKVIERASGLLFLAPLFLDCCDEFMVFSNGKLTDDRERVLNDHLDPLEVEKVVKVLLQQVEGAVCNETSPSAKLTFTFQSLDSLRYYARVRILHPSILCIQTTYSIWGQVSR